jgi:hypothetical protein
MLKVWPMYRIREVDGHDDEIMDTLADLHQLTFFDGASIPKFDHGHWWLAFHETMPVAFAGVVPSTRAYNAGYFCRVGVLKRHCGNALQLRLMRALESRARHNGRCCIVSDTTDNLASANNFIRAGPPDKYTSQVVGAHFIKFELNAFPNLSRLAHRCFEMRAFATSHPLEQPGFKTESAHH